MAAAPHLAPRAMIDPSAPAGAVGMKAVYKNLISAGFEPKYPHSLEAMDKARSNLDYLDLARDYNNVVSDGPGDDLTSAMLNARNSTHLTVIAPLMYTEGYQFRMKSADVLQIPFDQVGPGAIARVTTYNVKERFASLNMFKRALRFEMTKLQDDQFGPGAFTQGLQSLKTQADMTLSGMVSYALIDFPYMQRIARLTHPTRAFSHMREMLMHEDETAWLNHVDPVALVQKMIHMRTSFNKIDMAVVPGGAMTLVANTVGESRPMPAYQFILDSELRKYLMVAYDGNKSLTSIPLGDGTSFHIAENFAQRISIMDNEEEELQALRTEITLGEAALMPIRALDSPYPARPGYLDIGIADHQENEVTPKRISLGEMVGNSLIWRDRNGDLKEDADTDWMQELITKYNADMKVDVVRYFRDERYADNDEVPSDYLRDGLTINQMYGFRHFFGFLRIPEDRDDDIVRPTYLGDIEPKTLPPMHVLRGASMLERFGNFTPGAFAIGTAADANRLWQFCKRYLSSALLPAYADLAAFRDFFAAIIARFGNFTHAPLPGGILGTGPYTRMDPLHPFTETKKKGAKTSTSFRVNTSSRLMPLAEESFTAYDARLTNDALVEGVATGEIADGWAELLGHTADHAVTPVKQIVFQAHQAPAVSDTQADALRTFTEAMASYSLRAHTKDIAERAVTMMRNNGNALEAIAPRDGAPYLSTAGEARLNSAAAPNTALATAVRQAFGDDGDAMDIDTPATTAARASTSVFFVAGEDLGGGATVGGADDNILGRYSWKMYAELFAECESDVHKFLYAMILRSKFTRKACVALASAGFEVFRVVAMKINIHFLVDSIALLHAGYETMQMAFGHVIVLTGVDADAGYLTVNAQFHAGIICWKPEYMDMIPFAIGNRILGGRNNNAVRSVRDMFAVNSGRPSIIYVPTPVSETKYYFPLSLNNDAVYAAPNTEGVNAYHKGSWRDMLNVFAGDYHEGLMAPSSFRDNSSFYETSLIASNLHRACTWYYGEGDKMRPIPGTGPLGPVGRNVAGAHRAFNGVGLFPTNYESAMVY